MDLLLYAVCNAAKTIFILYKIQRNELRANRFIEELLETDDEVRLFYNSQY